MAAPTSWADGQALDRASAGAQFASNGPAGASAVVAMDVVDLWADLRPLVEVEPNLYARAVNLLAESDLDPKAVAAIELLHGSHRGAPFVVVRRGTWASGLPIRSDGGIPAAALLSAVAKAASEPDLAAG